MLCNTDIKQTHTLHQSRVVLTPQDDGRIKERQVARQEKHNLDRWLVRHRPHKLLLSIQSDYALIELCISVLMINEPDDFVGKYPAHQYGVGHDFEVRISNWKSGLSLLFNRQYNKLVPSTYWSRATMRVSFSEGKQLYWNSQGRLTALYRKFATSLIEIVDAWVAISRKNEGMRVAEAHYNRFYRALSTELSSVAVRSHREA